MNDITKVLDDLERDISRVTTVPGLTKMAGQVLDTIRAAKALLVRIERVEKRQAAEVQRAIREGIAKGLKEHGLTGERVDVDKFITAEQMPSIMAAVAKMNMEAGHRVIAAAVEEAKAKAAAANGDLPGWTP